METSTAKEIVVPLQSNLVETIRNVARVILEKAPEGLRAHDRRSLEHELEVKDEDVRTWMNLEFERDNRICSASLHVSFDSRYSERFVDADGNLWREYQVDVQTNWASFGAASPVTQLARLKLMTEVTEFAQELQAAFSGSFFKMVKTAAQAKAEREERESKEAIERVKTLVSFSRTKMRIGQERELDLQGNKVFEALPVSSWEVEMNDSKRYKFDKTGTHGAYITRLS